MRTMRWEISSQVEAAEAEYRKALSGNPSSSLGHIKLANALLSEGKLPDAIAELREALRIDPMSAAAHTDPITTTPATTWRNYSA